MYECWRFRQQDEDFDPNNIYDAFPSMFSIKLHHGGRFTKFPGVKYVDGAVKMIDLVDIDGFSGYVMDEIMRKIGYTVPPVIYYHYEIPNSDLDMVFRLRALANDEDIQGLAYYIGNNKLIDVYTEHGNTKLLTYFMSPKGTCNVRINEIEEDQPPSPTPVQPMDGVGNSGSTQQQLGFYMCMLLNANANANGSPELRTGRRNNGQSSCSKQLLLEYEPIVERRDEDMFVDMEAELGFKNDEENDEAEGDDSENDEEEGDEDDEESSESDEENDEIDRNVTDFLVDEENHVDEVDVDMEDFDVNMDSDADFVEGDVSDQRADDVDEGGEDEELDVINNDEWDSLEEESDEENKRKSILKQLGKEKQKMCNFGQLHKHAFVVGEVFKSKQEFKDKLDKHALESKRDLALEKNDKFRVKGVCKGVVPAVNAIGVTIKKRKGKPVNSGKVRCTWAAHVSRSDEESEWMLKTYNSNHICLQTRKLKSCTASFISKQIMSQVESNPDVPLRALQEQFEERHEVGVSVHKVFRAKAAATKAVVGDYAKQYELLRDYCLELQATNPDTTVKIEVDSSGNPSSDVRNFKRIYVCLGPLKKGFKACMRDLLGFDGAFMKEPYPGILLTAVGLDSNNGIYPLAYAIVESECLDSWKWFIDLVGDDLGLARNSNYTFISDRQNGLIPAIKQVFPSAEHRYCLRHIYDNIRKKWKTPEYKTHLWKCATATTVQEYDFLMKEFDQYDRAACKYVKLIKPKHWARSHFTGRAVSDVFISNMCEVFNSKLIKGREKPIISCLEFVREYLMKRICNVLKVINKSQGPLTPTATRLLKENDTQSSKYHARWNGASKYQVHGPWQDQHVVDTNNLTCTCRKWEITGIPCKHAIATLNEMSKSPEFHGDIYQWVHKVYFLDTWRKAYEFKVEPIKGRVMWPKSTCPTKLIPPVHRVQAGRPKKKRNKSGDEKLTALQKNQPDGVHKLTRKYITVTCGNCGQKGHNSRTCKGGTAGASTSQGRGGGSQGRGGGRLGRGGGSQARGGGRLGRGGGKKARVA